jgi:hypothetical protein
VSKLHSTDINQLVSSVWQLNTVPVNKPLDVCNETAEIKRINPSAVALRSPALEELKVTPLAKKFRALYVKRKTIILSTTSSIWIISRAR